jgi:hypothetical protein
LTNSQDAVAVAYNEEVLAVGFRNIQDQAFDHKVAVETDVAVAEVAAVAEGDN